MSLNFGKAFTETPSLWTQQKTIKIINQTWLPIIKDAPQDQLKFSSYVEDDYSIQHLLSVKQTPCALLQNLLDIIHITITPLQGKDMHEDLHGNT
jgi:hypothetical protein